MNRNYFSDVSFSFILQGFQGGKSALPEREIWNSRVNHTSDLRPMIPLLRPMIPVKRELTIAR
jgi:hypothetical protein